MGIVEPGARQVPWRERRILTRTTKVASEPRAKLQAVIDLRGTAQVGAARVRMRGSQIVQ
jgi:hypothetical protein